MARGTFNLDESTLTPKLQRRIRIRRLAVTQLEAVRARLDPAEARELDVAVVDHAHVMLRNALQAPAKAVSRRIKRTEAYQKFHALELDTINGAVRAQYRDAILGQCTPPLTAHEVAMADHEGDLPQGRD